jgi:hypothetical protein
MKHQQSGPRSMHRNFAATLQLRNVQAPKFFCRPPGEVKVRDRAFLSVAIGALADREEGQRMREIDGLASTPRIADPSSLDRQVAG